VSDSTNAPRRWRPSADLAEPFDVTADPEGAEDRDRIANEVRNPFIARDFVRDPQECVMKAWDYRFVESGYGTVYFTTEVYYNGDGGLS
jgi:hypothetical protein